MALPMKGSSKTYKTKHKGRKKSLLKVLPSLLDVELHIIVYMILILKQDDDYIVASQSGRIYI